MILIVLWLLYFLSLILVFRCNPTKSSKIVLLDGKPKAVKKCLSISSNTVSYKHSFKVYIEKKLIKEFRYCYVDGGVVYLYKVFDKYLYLKFKNRSVEIVNNSTSFDCKITVVFISFLDKVSATKNIYKKNYKLISKVYTKHSIFKVVDIVSFDAKNKIKIIHKFDTMQSAVQSCKNAYIIRNYKNLYSTKNKSKNNCLFCNDFTIKITTKNKVLNKFFNEQLTSILRRKNLTKNLLELLNFVEIESCYNFGYVCKCLYENKKYIELYIYILKYYLGVVVRNDKIIFLKERFYRFNFKLEYNDDLFYINNGEYVSVMYNGIVFNNIEHINIFKSSKQNLIK